MIEKTDNGAVKKSYDPPRLIEYGSMTKLTQGAAGSEVDGATGMVGMNPSD